MKFDDVKKLHQKKYRIQFGYYLVEGEHLILELQKSVNTQSDLIDTTLYVTEEYLKKAGDLLSDFTVITVSEKQMAQISDTKSPQGVVAFVPFPKTGENKNNKTENLRSIYLHEIQDPGNLGTILRSLAWFGGFRLLLSANSVDPYNPKVVRASMGAIFHVPIEQEVELSSLAPRFERIAYLDMHGTNIKHSSFANYQCFLFGNEARGVPTTAMPHADAFTISGSGLIDSLNLASAVNICAFQLSI